MSLDSLSDSELIVRIAERDRQAFDALYRRFSRRVLGLAIRRLKDRSGAEDAAQEAFNAVWRRAATYRPERGPGAPWLFAVDHVVDVPDSPTDEPGPDEQAEREWVRGRVHAAVAALPPRERSVIELAYWSDLSQPEIADRLGMPLGTVKTVNRRALARLASVLDGEALRGR